jgi:dGTP triphosphohydrolase
MSKNVMINVSNGKREDAFLSKAAIDRFKTDLRLNQTKKYEAYLKDGWSYTIKSNDEKDIIVDLTYEVKIFATDQSRQKEKLRERLQNLKKQRQPRHITDANLKKVPADIAEAYTDAQKSVPVKIMDPYDVITHPKKYQSDIQAIVQSTTHLSNPYTKYYNLVHNYLKTISNEDTH